MVTAVQVVLPISFWNSMVRYTIYTTLYTIYLSGLYNIQATKIYCTIFMTIKYVHLRTLCLDS